MSCCCFRSWVRCGQVTVYLSLRPNTSAPWGSPAAAESARTPRVPSPRSSSRSPPQPCRGERGSDQERPSSSMSTLTSTVLSWWATSKRDSTGKRNQWLEWAAPSALQVSLEVVCMTGVPWGRDTRCGSSLWGWSSTWGRVFNSPVSDRPLLLNYWFPRSKCLIRFLLENAYKQF